MRRWEGGAKGGMIQFGRKAVLILCIILFAGILSGTISALPNNNIISFEFSVRLDERSLQSIQVRWILPRTFLEQAIKPLTLPENTPIDEKDLLKVRESFRKYISGKGFYGQLNVNTESIPLQSCVTEDLLSIKGTEVHYSFTVDLDRTIYQDLNISLHFEESTHSLHFELEKGGLKIHYPAEKWNVLYDKKDLSEPISLYFTRKQISGPPASPPRQATPSQPLQKTGDGGIVNYLARKLSKLQQAIVHTLQEVKTQKSSEPLLLLIGFSLLYGMLHAAGPGHGKTLVSSYFLSHHERYAKALLMALGVAVVHVLSAYLLALSVYFLLEVILSEFVGDTSFYTTKLSGLIIIAIVLYLLWRKMSGRLHAHWSHRDDHGDTRNVIGCGCPACATSSIATDVGVVVAAGIVPCPGTVTILIFTISMGLYFTGFIAALVMSLGMGLVIALTAVVAVGLRQKIEKRFDKFIIFLEYASLIFIILLGTLLLLVDVNINMPFNKI